MKAFFLTVKLYIAIVIEKIIVCLCLKILLLQTQWIGQIKEKIYLNIVIYILKLWFWKTKIPDFIYDVEYEKLVNDKEIEIKKILNFCELNWDEKCLNPDKNSKTPIKTVSITQARQPIYKSSVNSSDNFDKYLEKMYKILD